MPDLPNLVVTEREHDSLLDVLRTYWIAIVATTILGGIVGYGFSHLVTPEYRATTTLYLRDPSAEGVFGQAPALGSRSARIYTEARLATSETTLAATASLLAPEYGEVSDLSRRVSVDPISDLSALRINATAPTAERALAYSEAITAAYRAATSAERRAEAGASVAALRSYAAELDGQLVATDAALAELEPNDPGRRSLGGERDALYAELLAARRAVHQLGVDAEIAADPIYRVDPAELPKSPARPQRQLNAGLAALIGLIGSIALVSWYDERGGPTHNPQKPRSILGRPLLASLPDATLRPEITRTTNGRRGASWDPVTTSALQSLTLALVDRPGVGPDLNDRVILFASSGFSDRTAETVLGTGLVAAQSDRRIILVDADLSNRRLAKIATGTPPPPNRSGAAFTSGARARGETTRPTAVSVSDDPNASLRVFTVGPDGDDPFGFFASRSFTDAIEQIRSLGDLILIYAPGAIDTPEGVALARAVDGVVLHIPSGTAVNRVAALRPIVDEQHLPLLGYVFDERSRNWGTTTATGWIDRRREAARPRPTIAMAPHRLKEEA